MVDAALSEAQLKPRLASVWLGPALATWLVDNFRCSGLWEGTAGDLGETAASHALRWRFFRHEGSLLPLSIMELDVSGRRVTRVLDDDVTLFLTSLFLTSSHSPSHIHPSFIDLIGFFPSL